MGKKVLVVVDVQNDFCTGQLSVPDYINIVSPIRDLIEYGGMDIIYTKDSHPVDHCSFKENGGSWPSHCIVETYGSDVLHELFNPNYRVVLKGEDKNKEEYGATIDQLDEYDDIYVVGITYEYCVAETALNLRKDYPDKRITVIDDCVAAIDRESDLFKSKRESLILNEIRILESSLDITE